MNREQMVEITDALTGAYRFMDFSGSGTFELWFEVLKDYELPEVRQGVLNWIRYSQKEPTPADILDATKNVRIANRKIAQDSVAWNEAVRCPKCNDKGFMLVQYPGGYEEFRACDCKAARENYPFFFTDDYQKRCEYEERRQKDPDVSWAITKYKFGLRFDSPDVEKAIRQTWKRRRFKEIRKVERSGQVIMMVEEVRR